MLEGGGEVPVPLATGSQMHHLKEIWGSWIMTIPFLHLRVSCLNR